MDKHLTSMDIKDPGLRSLPLGVERYLVKGGGLSVITLDPDDKIEITDTEGKQKCEIIVVDPRTLKLSVLKGVRPCRELNLGLLGESQQC